MAALSPAIRGGPALAVAILLALASPADAREPDPRHHFSVYGSLTPLTASGSSDSAMQMHSHLSKAEATVIAQAGGNLVLSAKLAESPMVCAGDTIFRDGFDP